MLDLLYPAFMTFLGAIIGATFADIDLAPPLPLKHRSAWTHGPLVPMAITWLVTSRPDFWWFGVGFLLTFAFHLLADMFPRMWHGSAMINLYPISLSLPPLLSIIYLAAGVAYSVWAWLGLTGLQGLIQWPVFL